MKAEPKTLITIKVSFDIELEYDPFKGRSIKQFAGLFEDDLLDALYELRPETQDVYNLQIEPINND